MGKGRKRKTGKREPNGRIAREPGRRISAEQDHVVNTLSGIAAIPKVIIEKQNVNLSRTSPIPQVKTTT